MKCPPLCSVSCISKTHYTKGLSSPQDVLTMLTYQYRYGLHFSAFARCDVSRHSHVEKVNPDCRGHFKMGGKVMACELNDKLTETACMNLPG